MINGLKNKALLGIVRQFIPDLQEQAAPMIEQVLKDIICETEDELRLGEAYAAITVVCKNGKSYICVHTMSERNEWVRTVERYTIEEVVNRCLNKFTNYERGTE